ncbi:TRAP transporter substrate-binding protein [Amaricoccus solimangrovi]|uniref:TRAP transporter substrate-binding protein n=1 Tax=Amaricoccus solimangrovi TaxID=2589815 RepID=A0A501W4T6_9RHOB|nr:TRAP transporter substrate-binding protein [Amaricoccus solimangrovi]TPE43802.1 TRAP transporter substrate-binding protein [Amaricoccus solimangrovi]
MSIFKTLATAALGLGLIAGAASAEELKFANFMAPTHPYVAGVFEPFATRVDELTNGDVTVRLYNGGELGAGPTDQYSRVVDGVTELAIGLPGYTASTFPVTLLTELPGVITEQGGTETIWNHIDLFQPEFRRVKLIGLWSSAPNLLYMRDKAVHAPADLKGLNIRVPSRTTGLLVEAWGGNPVSMPVSEIYNAMQTGVIDGAMIDGSATHAFKLGEVANHLTTGMNSTISPFFIVMNRDAFEGLSAEDQAALEKAGREASDLGHQVQVSEAAKGVEAFAAMPGKEVIRLTPEEAAAFDAVDAGVAEKVIAETGGDAGSVVDTLKAD